MQFEGEKGIWQCSEVVLQNRGHAGDVIERIYIPQIK